MDCFNCLKNGSPPYYTFLTNGSIFGLNRVSDAGSSIVNFFNDVEQCGPIPSSLGRVLGGAFAGAFGFGVAIMSEYLLYKKYYGARPIAPPEINNNAINNIFGIANPNYGLGLGRDDAPHLNPLLQNQNPDFERMMDFQHLVVQPEGNVDDNNLDQAAEEPELDIAPAPALAPIPAQAVGLIPNRRILGYSAYGRAIRRIRRYPEPEFGD